MNPEVKKEWVDALRSGNYQQGCGALNENDKEYCCLGVLTDLYIKKFPNKLQWDNKHVTRRVHIIHEGSTERENFLFSFLPEQVADWAGLKSTSPTVQYKDEPHSLAVLNDGGGGVTTVPKALPFTEIADLIEEQL